MIVTFYSRRIPTVFFVKLFSSSFALSEYKRGEEWRTVAVAKFYAISSASERPNSLQVNPFERESESDLIERSAPYCIAGRSVWRKSESERFAKVPLDAWPIFFLRRRLQHLKLSLKVIFILRSFPLKLFSSRLQHLKVIFILSSFPMLTADVASTKLCLLRIYQFSLLLNWN